MIRRGGERLWRFFGRKRNLQAEKRRSGGTHRLFGRPARFGSGEDRKAVRDFAECGVKAGMRRSPLRRKRADCSGKGAGPGTDGILSGPFRPGDLRCLRGEPGQWFASLADFRAIAESEKLFWGYSDLTALIGAILSRSGRPSALWQIRNLLEDDPAAGGQLQRFIGSVLGEGCSLFAPECRMLRGARMEGVGGGREYPLPAEVGGHALSGRSVGKNSGAGGQKRRSVSDRNHALPAGPDGCVFKGGRRAVGTFTELDREGKGAFAEEMVLELTPPRPSCCQNRGSGTRKGFKGDSHRRPGGFGEGDGSFLFRRSIIVKTTCIRQNTMLQ